jgi:hypothetical protein
VRRRRPFDSGSLRRLRVSSGALDSSNSSIVAATASSPASRVARKRPSCSAEVFVFRPALPDHAGCAANPEQPLVAAERHGEARRKMRGLGTSSARWGSKVRAVLLEACGG